MHSEQNRFQLPKAGIFISGSILNDDFTLKGTFEECNLYIAYTMGEMRILFLLLLWEERKSIEFFVMTFLVPAPHEDSTGSIPTLPDLSFGW